ncbi:ComEA family DNA-binding protein [Cellulomonas cellasea]|uniref:ComEA family DNA-binding protein n=1 Tax=Cellulomonas cellasea TaxID=43670 RepID=UPI0025A3C544|nr:ComEA family DNA-binding protein [Cellulomonas cellasea]MDM8086577.1 ComEA family DNA-binding protein [Cellulomonas cellasea]
MTASPEGLARDRLLGLATRPGHTTAAGPRWTPDRSHPEPPADAEAGTPPGQAARDAADVADRWRQGALARVGGLYAEEHGHPLEHGRLVDAPTRPRARRRWAVPLRLALTAAVAVALVGGGVAVRALSSPHTAGVAAELPEVAGPTGRAGDPSPGATAGSLGVAVPATAVPGGTVVVHVVGEVALPGLASLPAGSRVADAVSAVGGATANADLSAVNLARQLVDGEQVLVPSPGQAVAPGAGEASAADPSGPALVSLNEADLATLDDLPGIGPVLAERIVAWRQEHGRFADVEELAEVSGIGPALLGRLRPLVRV